MFCPNCGANIPDRSAFCPNCGANLGPRQAAPMPTPQPMQQGGGYGAQPQGQQQFPQGQQRMVGSPMPIPPSNGGKKRLPIVVGIVAAVLAIVVGAAFMSSSGGDSSGEGSAGGQSVETSQVEHGKEPEEVTNAKEHAAGVAKELCEQSQQILDAYSSGDSSSTATSSDSWLQTAAGEYDDLQNDLKVIQSAEQSAEDTDTYKLYEGAIQNMLDVIEYEYQLNAATEPMNNLSDDAGLSDYAQALSSTLESLTAMDVPSNYTSEMNETQGMCKSLYQVISYMDNSGGEVPILDQYSAIELLRYASAQASSTDYKNAIIDSWQLQCSYYSLTDQSVESNGNPQVVVNADDTIEPNLYPGLDCLLEVDVLADSPSTIKVEAQVPGFTEQFSQQYDVQQGATVLLIKPQATSTLTASDLQSTQDRQINYTVTDVDSGKVLKQESRQVKVKSLYDFAWNTNSYGTTTSYDILAWMRPDCDEVSQINRLANEYFSQWTGQNGMAGYQYGKASLTMAQIAAVQKAISDVGVTYQNDSFTLNANQSILTPDQVIQQKHGLCIETSLLMASCLQKLGIHALIILTPGHAQVAAELTEGGGDYVLLETTHLPYDGVTEGGDLAQFDTYGDFVTSPNNFDGVVYSEDTWKQFLSSNDDGSDGEVQVIDCDLAQTLDISGLAVQ